MIAHKVPTRSQRPPSGTSFHKVGGDLSEKAPSFTITSPRYGVKEATVWKGPSFGYARLPHRPVISVQAWTLCQIFFVADARETGPQMSFATYYFTTSSDTFPLGWAGVHVSLVFLSHAVAQ
jgi:hypothetical protein